MHLSYSQIAMYLDCGRRWQAHYKQDLKAPQGEALLFGSLAHGVIEKFVTDKSIDPLKQWETDWNISKNTPMFKSTIWDETPEVAYATGVRIFSSSDVMDTLQSITPGTYKKKIFVTDETGKPTDQFSEVETPAIEREIHWNLEDMPDIIGYIDCIQDDGVPVDFKTAGKMWAADKASKEIQPLFYLAALEQLGEHDHGFKFRHVVVTKARSPRIEIFEEQRSPVELEMLEQTVRRAWQGISSGLFMLNPTSWACNANYCGAYYMCVGKK